MAASTATVITSERSTGSANTAAKALPTDVLIRCGPVLASRSAAVEPGVSTASPVPWGVPARAASPAGSVLAPAPADRVAPGLFNVSITKAATAKASAATTKGAQCARVNSAPADSGPIRSNPTFSELTNRALARSNWSVGTIWTRRDWAALSVNVSAAVRPNPMAPSRTMLTESVAMATTTRTAANPRTRFAQAITLAESIRSTIRPAGSATSSQGSAVAAATPATAPGVLSVK